MNDLKLKKAAKAIPCLGGGGKTILKFLIESAADVEDGNAIVEVGS